ncbi:MAG: hypothetical protein R3351_03960 [Nitrospirales bacterium]|nr:hypothetical protein [Nitrospirales bacterium]
MKATSSNFGQLALANPNTHTNYFADYPAVLGTIGLPSAGGRLKSEDLKD